MAEERFSLSQLAGTLIGLSGMDHVAFVGEGISQRLPDERVTRVGLYQLSQIRENFPDHAIMPDEVLVSMKRGRQITTRNIITGSKQHRICAI